MRLLVDISLTTTVYYIEVWGPIPLRYSSWYKARHLYLHINILCYCFPFFLVTYVYFVCKLEHWSPTHTCFDIVEGKLAFKLKCKRSLVWSLLFVWGWVPLAATCDKIVYNLNRKLFIELDSVFNFFFYTFCLQRTLGAEYHHNKPCCFEFKFWVFVMD